MAADFRNAAQKACVRQDIDPRSKSKEQRGVAEGSPSVLDRRQVSANLAAQERSRRLLSE
jgi:hypothetical protein